MIHAKIMALVNNKTNITLFINERKENKHFFHKIISFFADAQGTEVLLTVQQEVREVAPKVPALFRSST